MGGCQNYGPFFGYPKYQVPCYIRDPKREPNFDNPPYESPNRVRIWVPLRALGFPGVSWGFGIYVLGFHGLGAPLMDPSRHP